MIQVLLKHRERLVDPVPVLDGGLVDLNNPREGGATSSTATYRPSQLAARIVEGLLHLKRAVAGLAHIIAWLQGVLNAEEAGSVTRGHLLLHLLLGDVGALAPHPDGSAQIVEVPTIELKEL